MAQDQKRGRQREQDPGSRVQERQGPGPSRSQEPSPARDQGCWSQMATGNRQARMWSQDRICNCEICKTFLGREMGMELGPEESVRRRLKVISTWTPPRTRSRSPCSSRQEGRSPSTRRSREEATCRDELLEATTPRSRSISLNVQGQGRSPYRQEAAARRPQGCSLDREELRMAWSSMDREELKKMRKQTENEKLIIERTRDALLNDVEKVSRSMSLMSMRVEEIVENVRNIPCNRCVDKGRFPEREHVLWSREASINKDDSRKPTEEMKRIRERLHREAMAARGVEAFNDSRLTKLMNAGGSAIVCCQLWAKGGGPIWKQVKVPENGDIGLLMMPVRRHIRSRSRVDLQDGREPEWHSSVWLPAAPEKEAQKWTGPGYGGGAGGRDQGDERQEAQCCHDHRCGNWAPDDQD